MPSKPAEYLWGREGEILRCPWHGWEFDITTGQSIFNPHKTRVRTYEVTVESGDVNARDPDDDNPTIETYVVGVEEGAIVLHV